MDEGSGTGRPQPGWWLYQGTGELPDSAAADRGWPAPPRWRAFDGGPEQPPPPPAGDEMQRRLGVAAGPQADPVVLARVNAALYLRRPLLVTGSPGSGKSSLAYRIARELGLGRVLRWQITTRTTLQSGLYDYDAIGRVQAAQDPDGADGATAGDFVQLGPLGTALLPYRLPRVLLVDELDNGDIDLPYDLREVFTTGEFTIRELARVSGRQPQARVHTADPGGTAVVQDGRVRCREFPVVVVTSNDERDLPVSFTRRCVQVSLPEPDEAVLTAIGAAHFPDRAQAVAQVLPSFLQRRDRAAGGGGLAADQFLDEVALWTVAGAGADWQALVDMVWPDRGGRPGAGSG